MSEGAPGERQLLTGAWLTASWLSVYFLILADGSTSFSVYTPLTKLVDSLTYLAAVGACCFEPICLAFEGPDVFDAEKTDVIAAAFTYQNAVEVAQTHWTVELKMMPCFPAFWQKVTTLYVGKLQSCLDNHV